MHSVLTYWLYAISAQRHKRIEELEEEMLAVRCAALLVRDGGARVRSDRAHACVRSIGPVPQEREDKRYLMQFYNVQ